MADSIAFALLLAVLVTAAVTDIRTGLIANRLTLPAMALGLLYWGIWGAVEGGAGGAMGNLGSSATALAVGLIPFAVLFIVAGALGGGDAKLMGAVGAISADWRLVVETALVAFGVAAVIALVLMVRHRIALETLRRVYAAVISTAARVPPVMDDQSPRVPFGLAIACGGIYAGLKFLLDVDVPLAHWGLDAR